MQLVGHFTVVPATYIYVHAQTVYTIFFLTPNIWFLTRASISTSIEGMLVILFWSHVLFLGSVQPISLAPPPADDNLENNMQLVIYNGDQTQVVQSSSEPPEPN